MSSKWEALAREIPANHEVKIGPAESAPDGSVRRLKDLTLFFFGLLVLVTVVAYSLVVLLTDCIAEEDRRRSRKGRRLSPYAADCAADALRSIPKRSRGSSGSARRSSSW